MPTTAALSAVKPAHGDIHPSALRETTPRVVNSGVDISGSGNISDSLFTELWQDHGGEENEHAWLPQSPCGQSCAELGNSSLRLSQFALTCKLLILPVVLLTSLLIPMSSILPKRYKHRFTSTVVFFVLRGFGVRLEIHGTMASDTGQLVVSNHVSWLDILVHMSLHPTAFVARKDLLKWPIIGAGARRLGTIGIDREKLRELPNVIATIGSRLAAGRSVMAFPEATTWCGVGHGRFRPALFHSATLAANQTGQPVRVQPVRFTYLDNNGEKTTGPAFVGAEAVTGSFWRIISGQPITVRVDIKQPLTVRPDRELDSAGQMARRQSLARQAHREVFGSHDMSEFEQALRS